MEYNFEEKGLMKKTELRAKRIGYPEINNYQDDWKSEDIDELKKMFNDGLGIFEIANKLQRSERAVFKRLNLENMIRNK